MLKGIANDSIEKLIVEIIKLAQTLLAFFSKTSLNNYPFKIHLAINELLAIFKVSKAVTIPNKGCLNL